MGYNAYFANHIKYLLYFLTQLFSECCQRIKGGHFHESVVNIQN